MLNQANSYLQALSLSLVRPPLFEKNLKSYIISKLCALSKMTQEEFDPKHNHLLLHGRVNMTLAKLSGLLCLVQKPAVPQTGTILPHALGACSLLTASPLPSTG